MQLNFCKPKVEVNKSVVIKYLNEHYSLVSGAGSDDENIQYLFTTPDKSTDPKGI